MTMYKAIWDYTPEIMEMIEISLQLGFANANEFHFDFPVTK